MRVRGLGRAQRLGTNALQIACEVRTDRRGTHRGPISERTLTTKELLSFTTPFRTTTHASAPLEITRVSRCAPGEFTRVGRTINAVDSQRTNMFTTQFAQAVIATGTSADRQHSCKGSNCRFRQPENQGCAGMRRWFQGIAC
jgi:hypothetical protein